MKTYLDQALRDLHRRQGSDLHLCAGSKPMFRISGDLQPTDGPLMTDEMIVGLLRAIAPERTTQVFDANGEADFRYEVPGEFICRVNFYRTISGTAAAFRVIPSRIPSLDELGLPRSLGDLAMLESGLVLVTGPTGQGKSTTTAAIVQCANERRTDHIITIEDPIEFTYRNRRCLITQREVGAHTPSFASALRMALREDPDIIVVGEMRDRETVALAVEAAETGHLVFATLHTRSAGQTIDRIIDIFPSGQQAQIRTSLADSLQAILSVSLMKRADGDGRIQAIEILRANPAIRNMIRESKTHQIQNALMTGRNQGMMTMDECLEQYYNQGLITRETAIRYARNPNILEEQI